MASRFGIDGTFYYDPSGTIAATGGTYIYLNQSQMPQYPFAESRVTDMTSYRNLGGQLTTYKNYSKVGYKFKWSYLDDSTARSMRRMFDSTPTMTFNTNGTDFGTFRLKQFPDFSEVQYLLFDIEMEVEEV